MNNIQRSTSHKIILVLNKEEVLLLAPLAQFLSRNANNIHAIYHTPFFPPQADKSDYIRTTLKISNKIYWLKYIIRLVRNKIFGSFIFPLRWRKKYSLNSLVDSYGIQFLELLDVNDGDFVQKIKNEKITTAFSLTSQLYRKEIINIPGFKIYNFHPSLLPNNKGRWPIFWGIVKGEEHGITCHEINEQIDAGEIVLQKNLGELAGNNIEQVMEVVMKEMPLVMSTVLNQILTDNLSKVISKHPSFYGKTPDQINIAKYWDKMKNI